MNRTEVDIHDVLAGLDALKAQGKDLRSVFRAVKEDLQDDVQAHFERNAGPDGPWAPRAASSLARAKSRKRFRRKRGKQAGQFTKRGEQWSRRQLGRFRNTNNYKFVVGRQHLDMVARGDWAGIHQFGGTAGHGARIPARPFLWASDTLLEKFAKRIEEHLHDGWGQGGAMTQDVDMGAFFGRMVGPR